MIQTQSFLKLIDNSGAKTIRCIRALNKSKRNRRPASIGAKLTVSICSAKFKEKTKVKAGNLAKSILVQCNKKSKRVDGSTMKSSTNSALLLNSQGSPSGTRLSGFLAYEVTENYNKKLWSMLTHKL